MTRDDSVAALLAQLEAEQHRLRGLLSGKDDAALAQRPPSGKWSVMENVRHLLFAEQLHLGHLLPGGQHFSPLGLAPPINRPKFRDVGSATPSTVHEVLAAWEAAHIRTRALVDHDTGDVRHALDRNLRHLRTHIRVIERLLRSRHP